ncbi:MAG: metallophosphoesterase family protein [Conexivisphaerales archaeon]|nr:metallophosphoesterase family protein [Conexivisphaerales archaeon]
MRLWRFVAGHPALLLEGDPRTLVVSDLHVGLEDELRRNGIFLPPQTQKVTGHIISLASRSSARRLVMLGDVKHSVTGLSQYELRELHEMFSALIPVFDEIIIVPGNHDAGLTYMSLGPIKLARQGGIVLDVRGRKVGLAHGHTRVDFISNSDLVVVGHNHLYVRGSPGRNYPVWVRCVDCGGLREVIVLPAFNELLGGAAVEDSEPRGPIMRTIVENGERAEIYTLDGYYLGNLSSLSSGLMLDAG